MEASDVSAVFSPSSRTRGKKCALDAAGSAPSAAESQEAPVVQNAPVEKDMCKHRVWEPWNSKTVLLFYEGLKQHGRNFEAIRQYIVGKTKSDAKRSIQVRNFYYNSWQKISSLLDFSYCHSASKEAKELFALINYGEWLRKTDFETIKDKHVATFNQLVRTGSTVVRLTGSKCGGKKSRVPTIKIRTPTCPALKKFMEDTVDVASVSSSHPGKVAVELLPDRWVDREFIADLDSNPYLRLSVTRDCTIDAVIELMIAEWKLKPGQRGKFDLSKWGVPGTKSEKQEEEPFVLNVSLCQDRESILVATSSVPLTSSACLGVISLERCFSSGSATRDVEDDSGAAFQPPSCSESSPDEVNEAIDDAALVSEFWYCSENCGDATVGQLLHVSKLPKILRLRYRLNIPATFITVSRYVRKCLLDFVSDCLSAESANNGSAGVPPNGPITCDTKKNLGSGATLFGATCESGTSRARLPLLESHRLLSMSRLPMLPRRCRKRRSATSFSAGNGGGLLELLAQIALDCSHLRGLVKPVDQKTEGDHFGTELLNRCASRIPNKSESANPVQDSSMGKWAAESFNDAYLQGSSYLPDFPADEKHHQANILVQFQDDNAEGEGHSLPIPFCAGSDYVQSSTNSQCDGARVQGPSTSAGLMDTFFDISLTDANSLFGAPEKADTTSKMSVDFGDFLTD
uniref:SANT domain-containing protein n=1 Tax=Trichuris muris TaxID=70415 RepID=A0A5S6QMI4_TRIMR